MHLSPSSFHSAMLCCLGHFEVIQWDIQHAMLSLSLLKPSHLAGKVLTHPEVLKSGFLSYSIHKYHHKNSIALLSLDHVLNTIFFFKQTPQHALGLETFSHPSSIFCQRTKKPLIQYFLPVFSYKEQYTLIFLSGVQRERTREEKMLTDHMGLNVLFPRELNSLEGLYYRLLRVCSCTKKLTETADMEDKKPEISEVMNTGK